MNFTLDFQGKILKWPYLRNGREGLHETRWIWVDRMSHTLDGLNFDLTYNCDFGFLRLNLEIAISQE